MTSSLDILSVNTLRTLAIDAIEKANSGHPGLPMGAAPMAYVLWRRFLSFNPQNPDWANRDRFVLSAGHGSMLQYGLLHLFGYDLSVDELKSFRQWGSRTAGHPEYHLLPGVEATTGPLGQGTANTVGMAIAERMLAGIFNRPGFDIVDHHTYGLVSDGDLMEGVASECASLAGHLGLGKLIWLYDSNGITLDGPAAETFTEDVAARHIACGWHVETVNDGDTDLVALALAIEKAQKEKDKPSLIVVKTTIGYGSPNRHGTSSAHGSPLGAEEIALTKKALQWDHEPFFVPEQAKEDCGKAGLRGAQAQQKWQQLFDSWAQAHPELARTWDQAMGGELPPGWDADLPTWNPPQALATRAAGGLALNAVAAKLPFLVGGDADLSSSTKTRIKNGGFFSAKHLGRNIQFGIREHAMAGIANGIAYHRGLCPFVSTFFPFVDYMRPAVRLAAMMKLPVKYVFTHDSVAVGEDGPTHQPVEHLMSLRIIPNMVTIRPADPNETAAAWRFATQYRDGPVALILSRQSLPTLEGTSNHAMLGIERGAYVLADCADGEPTIILIATGSEVVLATLAQAELSKEGISARVVSMPSWELFARQDETYRESVLPCAVTARVSIEAGCTHGWERWVGGAGMMVGINRFGASAPGDVVLEKLGMTVEAVVDAARSLL